MALSGKFDIGVVGVGIDNIAGITAEGTLLCSSGIGSSPIHASQGGAIYIVIIIGFPPKLTDQRLYMDVFRRMLNNGGRLALRRTGDSRVSILAYTPQAWDGGIRVLEVTPLVLFEVSSYLHGHKRF